MYPSKGNAPSALSFYLQVEACRSTPLTLKGVDRATSVPHLPSHQPDSAGVLRWQPKFRCQIAWSTGEQGIAASNIRSSYGNSTCHDCLS